MTILGQTSPVTLPRRGVKPPQQSNLDATPKAHAHGPIAAAMASALPASTNNVAKLVARKDQGQSSACTAHSLSALVATVCAMAGVVCVDPSEHVLYSRSGEREGSLDDDGREMLDVWACAVADGFAPQGTCPDGRNSDVWTQADLDAAGLTSPPPNVSLPATAEELALASKCRPALTLVHVDPKAADLELQVRSALASGHLVWTGETVGNAFQGLASGQVAQPDPAGDPSAGGHATFFVDYRTTASGDVEYLLVNSWSEAWDGTGMAWCSAAFLRSCFEVHAIGVTSNAPNPTLLQTLEADLSAIEAKL